jgi:hypothetical protein
MRHALIAGAMLLFALMFTSTLAGILQSRAMEGHAPQPFDPYADKLVQRLQMSPIGRQREQGRECLPIPARAKSPFRPQRPLPGPHHPPRGSEPT